MSSDLATYPTSVRIDPCFHQICSGDCTYRILLGAISCGNIEFGAQGDVVDGGPLSGLVKT